MRMTTRDGAESCVIPCQSAWTGDCVGVARRAARDERAAVRATIGISVFSCQISDFMECLRCPRRRTLWPIGPEARFQPLAGARRLKPRARGVPPQNPPTRVRVQLAWLLPLACLRAEADHQQVE